MMLTTAGLREPAHDGWWAGMPYIVGAISSQPVCRGLAISADPDDNASREVRDRGSEPPGEEAVSNRYRRAMTVGPKDNAE